MSRRGRAAHVGLRAAALAAVLTLAVVAPAGAAAAAPAPGPAARPAQIELPDGFEQIRSFDAEYVVEDDGTLAVTETIVYDFGDQERRGILRDLVTLQDIAGDDRYDRAYPVSDVRVETSPGAPDDLLVETLDAGAGEITRIRIGDPEVFITGQHTYTIRYRQRGTLNAFASHDELYWNVTGDQWTVPIMRASVTVRTPAPVEQVACFAGSTGSNLACPTATADGSSATFSAVDLFPGQQLTIVVALPKGAVVPEPEPILEERWSLARAFTLNGWTIGISAGLLALVVGGAAAIGWRVGRDRRAIGSAVDVAFATTDAPAERVGLFESGEGPVEFVPPEGIRPGQVGTLVDEQANPLDVTATIVDLAVRGYLRIEEVPKEGWFGKDDWRLVRLREPDGLRQYERTLFHALFSGSAQETLVSELRYQFADDLRKVQNALYDDAVAQGWFAVRPDRTRTHWRVVAGLVIVFGIAALVAAVAFTKIALVAVPLVIGGFVLWFMASRMPRRTPKGVGTVRRVFGFRRFIVDSEAHRAEFAERKNIFSEYLPYAIVFGVVDKWAKAFEGLDDEVAASTAGWYLSTRPFVIADFSHAVDGFATVSVGTLAAVQSTSGSSGVSGFSGGGFSGGGGGGGGGGSW